MYVAHLYTIKCKHSLFNLIKLSTFFAFKNKIHHQDSNSGRLLEILLFKNKSTFIILTGHVYCIRTIKFYRVNVHVYCLKILIINMMFYC